MTNTVFIRWIIAFLSFPPSGALATALIGSLDTPLEGIFGGLIVGLGVGAAQMWALRPMMRVGWAWVAATAIGFSAGVSVSIALFGASPDLSATLTRAPLTGLILGTAQAVVLMRYRSMAWIWIITLVVLFPLAWWVTAQVITTSLQTGFVIFGASGALVYQLITGVVLWRLPQKA